MPSKSQQEPYPDPSQPSGSRLGRTTSNISPRSPPSVAATSEANSTRTGKSSLPRHKIQALESFVKFGRKGKENAAEPEFPPDEWFKHATPPAAGASGVGAPSHASDGRDSADIHKTLEETWSASGASPNLTSLKRVGSGFAPSPVQPDVSQAHSDSPSDDRRASSAPDTPVHEEAAPPEPMTLARRIQSLLTRSQPAVPALTNDPSSSSSSGGPITADIAPTDPSLLSLLSNASVMNGKSTGQGVFALLDRLRIRSPVPATSASSTTPGTAIVEAVPREDEDSDENSSLMLYAPLEPDENSEVELAASDCMSVFDDGETLEFETPARPLSMLHTLESHTPTRQSPLAASALPSTPEPEPQPEQEGPKVESEGTGETRDQTWFGTFRDRVVEGSRAVSASLIARRPTGGENPTEEESEVQTPAREPVRTTVRWVPSPDKISFQATWWGYRLYLPPPVLEVLNNKRLEAAKRAALITAALQWLLGNVPLTLVPPQFRVGLALTQRLVPYLGYIGAFVAWSWGAMKSFDKGHGITLTATWLLPIALVPGSWEAADFRERERPENSATAGPSTSAAES